MNAAIEALIFTAEDGITREELIHVLGSEEQPIEDEFVQDQIEQIREKYGSDAFGFELVCSGGRYRFLTKKSQHALIQKMYAHRSQKKLSQSAMETLSIIAYRQPCFKSDVEAIRGVNCDYAIDKLLEKNLIHITGQSDAPGKPLIYATTEAFMDYLGINTLSELPQLKEIGTENNS
ncbi:MAG: SMC-Scp complex subunit ScpB [Mucilaginibacter polytrichastri]|nr:SMC-Scp complex subunit ScpB [Mucilaginibacter polytrichastri]